METHYIFLIGFVIFLIIIELTKKDKTKSLNNYNGILNSDIIVTLTEKLTIKKPHSPFNVNIFFIIVYVILAIYFLFIITLVSFFVSSFYLLIFSPFYFLFFFLIKNWYNALFLKETIIINDREFILQSKKIFRKKELRFQLKNIIKFTKENNKLQLLYNDDKSGKIKVISFFKLANEDEETWVLEKIDGYLNRNKHSVKKT